MEIKFSLRQEILKTLFDAVNANGKLMINVGCLNGELTLAVHHDTDNESGNRDYEEGLNEGYDEDFVDGYWSGYANGYDDREKHRCYDDRCVIDDGDNDEDDECGSEDDGCRCPNCGHFNLVN